MRRASYVQQIGQGGSGVISIRYIQSDGRPHRIAVVGAGFAGVELVQGLKGAPVAITLIDQHNHHLFQPLLYQAATAILAPSEIAWPIRQIFRNRPDVEVLLGTVTGIDRVGRKVLVSDGNVIPFDTLIIATGVTHAYFGHPEWEEHAPGLKTIDDATAIRRRILLAFETAERTDDAAQRAALLTFVVVGGGATGVELAGMIAELAHGPFAGEFRRIDTRSTRVVLVEAGKRILNGFDTGLANFALKTLRERGVDVRLGAPVTAISAEGASIAGDVVSSRTILWAAGVRASPAATWLDVDEDDAGRVKVSTDLSIPGDDRIFVIGDTAHVRWRKGRLIPGIAPAAKQQGAYVAGIIRARFRGELSPKPFRYRHHGDLATIGRQAAIVDLGWVKVKGALAWWFWGIAHIYFLVEGRSRVAVMLSWLWSYFRRRPSAQLIAGTVAGAAGGEVGRCTAADGA